MIDNTANDAVLLPKQVVIPVVAYYQVSEYYDHLNDMK